MCAGVLNAPQTDNLAVYLTLLGGGASGNEDNRIFVALQHAFAMFDDKLLDVVIISYGQSNPYLQQLLS